MNLTTLALIVLVLAALPAGLFLVNLLIYRPISCSSRRQEAHSENAECGVGSAELKSAESWNRPTQSVATLSTTP